jgi:hypothetical protein
MIDWPVDGRWLLKGVKEDFKGSSSCVCKRPPPTSRRRKSNRERSKRGHPPELSTRALWRVCGCHNHVGPERAIETCQSEGLCCSEEETTTAGQGSGEVLPRGSHDRESMQGLRGSCRGSVLTSDLLQWITSTCRLQLAGKYFPAGTRRTTMVLSVNKAYN